jgi:hypothetical protein
MKVMNCHFRAMKRILAGIKRTPGRAPACASEPTSDCRSATLGPSPNPKESIMRSLTLQLIGVLAAASVPFTSVALAGQDQGMGMGMGGMGTGTGMCMGMGNAMPMMDSNKDGKISREEHRAGADAMFTAMDTDKDGFLTRAEMAAAHAPMQHRH